MNHRQSKEKHMADCKAIGGKIQKLHDKLDYYPTYRQLELAYKSTYTTMYNIVQEAINNGWVSEEIKAHYGRKIK
jgi:hypothetical protein